MSSPPQSLNRTPGSERRPPIEGSPEELIEFLSDEDCRRIFQYAAAPVAVPELIEELDLPVSTAYRKVDELSDEGLLTEIRSENGNDPSRYVRSVEAVEITVGDEVRVEASARNVDRE